MSKVTWKFSDFDMEYIERDWIGLGHMCVDIRVFGLQIWESLVIFR